MKRLILILLIFAVLQRVSFAQCPPGTYCPPEGKNKYCQPLTDDKDRALNMWKNKSVNDPGTAAEFWDIGQIIGYSNSEDKDIYRVGDYRYVEGYIVDWEEEGPESCNCHMASKAQKTGDLHIFLGTKPNAPKSKCVIVEITPKFKRRYVDYANKVIIGTKVRVWGYRIYDHEHRGNAAMTCMSCRNVWRKTNWEIHPIVWIQRM